MCYITKWHCGSKMCYQWGICVTNVLPLDKISLTIVLKKVVYFADYKHITLPATQRNHLDPILCYHRPHASHEVQNMMWGNSDYRVSSHRFLYIREAKTTWTIAYFRSIVHGVLLYNSSIPMKTTGYFDLIALKNRLYNSSISMKKATCFC